MYSRNQIPYLYPARPDLPDQARPANLPTSAPAHMPALANVSTGGGGCFLHTLLANNPTFLVESGSAFSRTTYFFVSCGCFIIKMGCRRILLALVRLPPKCF